MRHAGRVGRVLVVSLAGFVVPVGAQTVEPPHEPSTHDPYAAPPAVRRVGPPRLPGSPDGLFVLTRQANVTPGQMNIAGDAANEPSIAIDPTAPNRLVIGWRQFDTIASNFRQAGYAWSNDGGRTWHFEGSLTPGVFRSDPVLETDAEGHFYYYTLPGAGGWRCEIFSSADGGRTWAGPVLANGGDRAWMTIDKSGSTGNGFIYGIWNPSYGCCGTGSFGRDLSAGTLPWPAPVSGTPIWGTIGVGPDGEVYVGGRSGSTPRVVRSDNARNPAATPTFPQGVNVNLGGGVVSSFGGPNPGGALGQVWIDVNRSSGPARGHVYLLALVDPAGTDPADVMFARSTDGGQTWGTPVRVNTDPAGASNWSWFPSLSVAPGGRLDVTYNSTHGTGSVNLSRFYYTFSLDEGTTWSAPVALTPAWDSTVGWPNQNKIGDYYDQESDDVGLFVAMAATLNGEQDVFFMRVGAYDCNRNGVADPQDIALGTAQDCNANEIPDSCEIAAGAVPDANHNGIPDPCETCYANCDASTGPGGAPTLNINDFVCFQTKFALGDPYADCDGNGQRNVNDYICFQTKFALGC